MKKFLFIFAITGLFSSMALADSKPACDKEECIQANVCVTGKDIHASVGNLNSLALSGNLNFPLGTKNGIEDSHPFDPSKRIEIISAPTITKYTTAGGSENNLVCVLARGQKYKN